MIARQHEQTCTWQCAGVAFEGFGLLRLSTATPYESRTKVDAAESTMYVDILSERSVTRQSISSSSATRKPSRSM